jgi:hypothetical protein
MLLNAPFLIEGKQTREVEILEEVVFYGEGKDEEIQGRKEKERGLIKGKGGPGNHKQGKGNLDQRGDWKEVVFGRKEGFRGSRSSRLLGLVFCLMMIGDDVVFH